MLMMSVCFAVRLNDFVFEALRLLLRLVVLMISYSSFSYDRCVIVLVIRLLLLVLIFLRLVFLRLVYEVLLVSCLCDLFPALRAVRSVLS